ncbi:PAS domain S-box-containing protein [Roseiarcus fermentans]|uniref:histidine kinase n=1 Tax=Roseiarcus fermentans TaxID=1473586 RepID=A0A366EV56_9HYPH|nr:PAS domain-containing protein [Roseiarcus fermentans]RBP06262.1 PAS domain S-box-containing protein [Roseiarcus fermentans]
MVDTAKDELWVVRWTTDGAGAASFDETWSDLTGQTPSEASPCGWLDAIHPEDAPAAADELRACLAQRTAFRHAARVRLRNGSYRWMLGAGAPRFDALGFVGFAGAILDIHHSRAARRALSDKEEKLRLALAAAEMGTFVWDLEQERCERDARMLELFGRPPDGSLSLNSAIERDLHPEDRQRFADALARARDPAGDGRLCEDVRVPWPDGTIRWLQISARVRFSEQPRRPVRMVGTAIDVTAREKAKDAIRESEERLSLAHERMAAALRASPVVAFEHDRELRFIWIQNPAPDFRPEDVVGKTVSEVIESPEDARPVIAIKQRVLETGVPARQDLQIPFRGVARWYDLIVQPRRNASGEIVGLLCTATDITEHKRAEESLQEADRRKDQFLAVLGHELRNPLASIQNGVSTLRLGNGPADPDTAGRIIDLMARQAAHLGRLVDDLLDVSRINRDKIELRREPVDIGFAVREALETTRPQRDDKRLRVDVTLPAEPLTVTGDPTRLSQVVTNLIHNAIKYTDDDGSIRIRVEREDEHALVTVADNGVGIAPEILPRVFDLFMQADPAPMSGLGIGLMLSKRLVELHGGTIEANSPGLHQGSVFTVRLPLQSQTPESSVPGDEGNHDGADMGVKVLVIDDNRDVADSFATLLRSFRVPVRVAYSGKAGVAAAADFGPDIAFIDIRMPGIDGYETARRIRALPLAHRPTLVALSGLARREGEETAEAARAAGFDLHINKPASVETIRDVIARNAATTVSPSW